MIDFGKAEFIEALKHNVVDIFYKKAIDEKDITDDAESFLELRYILYGYLIGLEKDAKIDITNEYIYIEDKNFNIFISLDRGYYQLVDSKEGICIQRKGFDEYEDICDRGYWRNNYESNT